MEPQTDLIILINMEEMYLDNWKDMVVDQIDAKYPFKDRYFFLSACVIYIYYRIRQNRLETT